MKEITPAQAQAIENGSQPDCDICRECGEHAEFADGLSECCGARAWDSDPDTDLER